MVNCTFEEAEKGGGMMKVYKTPSKDVQEIILANVTYETVIDGLNGYFASEPRNNYITVKMESDKQNFALYEAEAWADILIEWLRKKHDIFYRPGLTLDQVEAARNAAKMCCLRAHIKDEISKRGLWCGADADIPELVEELFKKLDWQAERADRNRRNATKLSEVSQELKKERDRYLKQRDTAVADYQALAEENQKRDTEIKNLKERIAELESNFKAVCDEDDIFRTRALKAEEEVRKLNAELKSSQKSDVNKLIRDCCTEHGVIAPSRYFSDEACVEYLVTAIKQKEAKDAQKEAKQECYDYLWNALKKLSPECDALKINRYEDLVDRIFFEMCFVTENCKQCQRRHSTEKFDYIRRTNKAEEELKRLKEQMKAKDDRIEIEELNTPAVDAEKRAYGNILAFILFYWERFGYDRNDILCRFEGVSSPDLTLTIEKLIGKYAEKDRQAQTCDVELKRARDTIETLKRLINDVNAELEDY